MQPRPEPHGRRPVSSRGNAGEAARHSVTTRKPVHGGMMAQVHSIYTEKRECQDCHKCIRECPVKAIRVQDGYARIVPELCILCGNCILACPNRAKQVRDDLPTAKGLVASGRRVVVSLAPSFVAQFPGVRPQQLVSALKQLGFFAVSETAVTAREGAARIFEWHWLDLGRLGVSSRGPRAVGLF